MFRSPPDGGSRMPLLDGGIVSVSLRMARLKLQLACPNQQLESLCRDILCEIPGQNWTVSVSDLVRADSGSDLYIWDADYRPLPFEGIHPNNTWRHFFLVDRSNLQHCRGSIP